MNVEDMSPEFQLELYKTLDAIDLFFISFKSPLAKQIIQSLPVEYRKTGIFVRTVRGRLDITVLSKHFVNSKLLFTTRSMPSQAMKKKAKQELWIDGNLLKVRMFTHEPRQTIVYLNKKYQNAMFTVLINYICELFNESVFGSVLHKWNRTLNLSYSEHMFLASEDKMMADKLDSFAHHVTCGTALFVANKIKGLIPRNSPLYYIDNLFLMHSTYLRAKDLMRFQGEHALFTETSLATTDIIQFLDHWIAGKSGNVETMIAFTTGMYEITARYIIERYGARLWNPFKRARHYVYKSAMRSILLDRNFDMLFDCAKAYDIQRRDGLIATLRFSSNYFFFFVWHERFPIDHELEYIEKNEDEHKVEVKKLKEVKTVEKKDEKMWEKF